MNSQLIDSLARIILSLSAEERDLLARKVQASASESLDIQSQISDLQNRLKNYESQHQMSSEEFYDRFRSGELGDDIDFFEWSIYYEMLLAAREELALLQG